MSVQLVSKEAGVSVATVSRVINHSRNVAPETVSAVRLAMTRVGYVPPPVEKRQRRKKPLVPGVASGNIALLIPDTDDRALRTALSGRFMHGVGEVLRAQGLNMIVTSLVPSSLSGFAVPPCIRDERVDGVIIRGCDGRSDLIPLLGDLACVWLLDGDVPARGDQVLEDNASVARLALEHLIRRGCQRVAALNPMGLHYGYRARCDWFGIRARRAGLAFDEYIHAQAPEVSLMDTVAWQPALLELVERLVASPVRPDGIFLPFPDDLITFVYRALADRGIRAGVDVELVCCSYDPPRLSTLDAGLANVDILPEAMGRAAVETLLWRLRNPNEPQRRTMVVPALSEGQAPRPIRNGRRVPS